MSDFLDRSTVFDAYRTLALDNDYIFTTITERDEYFTMYDTELVADIYCSCGDELYKYVDGSWLVVSTLIDGKVGDTGATGDSGVGFYPQYSNNNVSWHNIFDSSEDKYIRVASIESDGTESYSDGKLFVGSDGTSTYPQYSDDNSSWHETFDNTTDLYIRFVTIDDSGEETYSDGGQFIGESADDMMLQFSVDGSTDWHDKQEDTDYYWRWSLDGGKSYSSDFTRCKTGSDVSLATNTTAGIIIPDQATLHDRTPSSSTVTVA